MEKAEGVSVRVSPRYTATGAMLGWAGLDWPPGWTESIFTAVLLSDAGCPVRLCLYLRSLRK